MNQKKILVVDDEQQICSMIVRLLNINNYQADTASNGKEALAKIQENEYEIVLTDIKMPEMDGIALIKAAKEFKPNLIFIVISGFGTLDIVIETMKIGAINFIKKPISVVELLSTIKKAEDLILSRNLPIEMSRFIEHVEKVIKIGAKDLIDQMNIVVNYLTQDLTQFGLNPVKVENIIMALYETLNNAVEHGCLHLEKILSRESDPELFENYLQLKLERVNKPEFQNKPIHIVMKIEHEMLSYRISDPGEGFDYSHVVDQSKESVFSNQLSKGIFLIKNAVDEIKFNDKGNEIQLNIRLSDNLKGDL